MLASKAKREDRVQAPEVDAWLRLERRRDGQLWATAGPRECPVRVLRCFPWSEPTRFISLRDVDNQEVALVHRFADLDGPSREVLSEALAEAGFVLRIERIDAVEEEIEIRSWKVRTPHGARSFQTLRDEWPREMPGGGLLIEDVAGDLFYIEDPQALDAASRELLWAFLD